MLPNFVVPVLNRYDLLQRMLDTIDMKIAHLVLIDNGDNMTEMRFPDYIQNVHYIPLPGNLGVAGSWNLGIKVLPHHDRWFIGSNDIMLMPGDLAMMADAKPDELTLSDPAPHFQFFAVGEEVVREVGLFDENYYPAYFEDNDYMLRCRKLGYNITKLQVGVKHDNSSTIRSNQMLAQNNSRTFADNQKYFRDKHAQFDTSPGNWSLTRRRRNEWLR